MAQEIHQMAKEKGWWEVPSGRSFWDQTANYHAEVSEAWEEYRNGHGLTELYEKIWDISGTESMNIPYGSAKDPEKVIYNFPPKPEGIPIELADVVIRILDTCGAYGFNIRSEVDRFMVWEDSTEWPSNHFGKFTSQLHKAISECNSESEDGEIVPRALGKVVGMIIMFCKDNGIYLERAIRIKREFNATRPHRHGGKIA